MDHLDYLSAREALERLNIKPQTLYAYVSRGFLRAIPDPGHARRSLYSRHDVEALLKKRKRPRGRADVAAGAITWGEPVLESGISTVRDGELYFGELKATDLARKATLEAAAALHWQTKHLPTMSHIKPLPVTEKRPKARAFSCLSTLAARAPPSRGRTRAALIEEGSKLLAHFATAICGRPLNGAIHRHMAQSWGAGPKAEDAIRRALVLISDHELNPSTFAVRVTASTGASLPASALSGFATLTGPLHGEASTLAYQFLKTALEAQDVNQAIAEHIDADGHVPGFGHPLYPEGDPRARELLEALPTTSEAVQIVTEASSTLGHLPNVDLALSALTQTYDLPRDAPFSLFALGRLTGWLAHAMEQIEYGSLIRPRARYVVRS